MTFSLTVNGPDIFTVAAASSPPASMLDPSMILHAGFMGVKLLTFTWDVVRTSGSTDPNPSDDGFEYSSQTTISFGKSFTVPPLVLVGGYDDYHDLYLEEGVYEVRTDSSGAEAFTWGSSWIWHYASGGHNNDPVDGITITTYDFDGTVNIFVMDGP